MTHETPKSQFMQIFPKCFPMQLLPVAAPKHSVMRSQQIQMQASSKLSFSQLTTPLYVRCGGWELAFHAPGSESQGTCHKTDTNASV